MKVREALEIGYSCGLETVGEAVDYITIHSMNIFAYDDITDELQELYREVVERKLTDEMPITDILDRVTVAKIDKELGEI